MTTRLALLTLAALTAGACGGEPEAPAETVMSPIQVLPNIALPPSGQIIGTEGGTEAASLIISTPMESDSVAGFYRDVLSRPPYRLINESVNGQVTSFYGEQDGPPLWVTVEHLEAGGTLVRLAGAAIKADTTATTDTSAT
jgi:hypothetical protein